MEQAPRIHLGFQDQCWRLAVWVNLLVSSWLRQAFTVFRFSRTRAFIYFTLFIFRSLYPIPRMWFPSVNCVAGTTLWQASLFPTFPTNPRTAQKEKRKRICLPHTCLARAQEENKAVCKLLLISSEMEMLYLLTLWEIYEALSPWRNITKMLIVWRKQVQCG